MLSAATLGFSGLTPLTSFNSLLLSYAAFHEGEMEQADLEREVAQFLTDFRFISEVFHWESQFRDRLAAADEHSSWGQLIDAVSQQLERVHDRIYLLLEEVERQGWSALPENRLEPVRASLERLFERFTPLREAEQRLPQLASSPYISELLRACQLAQQGRLPLSLLGQRLTAVSRHFQALHQQLAQQPLHSPEVEQVLELLEVQDDIFQQMQAALEQQQLPASESLEALRQGCDQALELFEKLHSLQGTPTRWCDRCQVWLALPEEAQQCPACQGPLGQPQVGSEPWEVLMEAAERAHQRGLPEDWDDLSQRIQPQLQQVDKMLKELPKAETPVDFETPLREYRQALEGLLEPGGLEVFRRALDQMMGTYQEAYRWMESQASAENST